MEFVLPAVPVMAESAVPVVVTKVVPEGPGSLNKTDQELLDNVKSKRNISLTQQTEWLSIKH